MSYYDFEEDMRYGFREDRKPFPPEITEKDLAEAKRLIALGYRSTSNKYRMVARLPEGMNGMEAMLSALPEGFEREDWAYRHSIQASEGQFLRCYAKDKLELTIAVFKAFKRLGGPCA